VPNHVTDVDNRPRWPQGDPALGFGVPIACGSSMALSKNLLLHKETILKR
jgi:hypothetical protein